MVNEGNYSKNARKNMDFIKSNNKNRYVNFFAHRNKSNNKKNENLKYLTVPQVLWDFIDVIKVIKDDDATYKNITNKAVIVGGGSYGGMLSAWMRMKYPN